MTSKETLSFSLQACSDAHLAITSVPLDHNQQSAEVVFGADNNQEVRVIPDRQDSDSYEVAHVHNVLDCGTPREFWISWDGGVIRAGRGTPQQDELVSSPHSWVNMSSVSLTTGNNQNGIWKFHKREGACSQNNTCHILFLYL